MINAAFSVLTRLIVSCSRWRSEWLLLLFLTTSVLPGQNPSIARLEPASFVIGAETLVEIEGENLLEASSLLTSFSATAKVELRSPAMARFSVLIPQEASPGIGALRVVSSNGISSWRLVVVDHLPPPGPLPPTMARWPGPGRFNRRAILPAGPESAALISTSSVWIKTSVWGWRWSPSGSVPRWIRSFVS